MPASTWVHAAGTYDGTALRIYVNGALNATKAVTGTMCANAEPLEIWAKTGTTPPATTEVYMDGRIYYVRVYDRARAAAEIKTVRTTPRDLSHRTLTLGTGRPHRVPSVASRWVIRMQARPTGRAHPAPPDEGTDVDP